ncbi:uncharacterized protein KY384_008363 [Bacidia gigantensis]|uniref:uncharacterized protein n=1 Tax=Bacidia gigantensis TaxID=2732470 RepID=UPI001D03AD7F|nr:uncharacterized protein KY384_008363 [Bacidia gigantensis]KAG8526934.1 hypothetical protein KY384_008363 [Bacidia gigantensis]
MQIASMLSDLMSLRVCDYSAALALVSAHKDKSGQQKAEAELEQDKDIRRVRDLLELHYGVKVKHQQGDDEGLRQARVEVEVVLRELDSSES